MFKRLLTSGLVLLLLCSCITYSLGQEKLQDLIILTGADASTFDPHFCTDSATEIFNKNIYNNLVRFNSNLDILPDLAERWEVSTDGLSWTFYLRENVKFHDGTPFNAEAVKISFDRLLDPETGSPRRSVLENIAKTEVLSDNVVVITTTTPFGALLNMLAHPVGAIISPSALEKYGKDLGTHPVGTGPFIFNEWKTDEELILDRNPDYFDGAPKIKRVIFRVVPDDSTRSLLLEAGQADVALRLPVTELERLKDKKELNITRSDTVMTMYVPLNNTKDIFKDVRVRKALNYATDKELIINEVLEGMATIGDAPISPYTNGYSSIGVYEYDVEKAKELLSEAGYPNGIDGIELWTPVGRYFMDVKTCENLQDQWKKAGINVKIRQWEFQALMSEIKKGEFDMLFLGWSPSSADADQGLYPVFHSTQFPPNSNRALYANSEVDRLLVEAKTEVDSDKRDDLYRQAQEILVDEAPWVFLYYIKQAIVSRNNVDGLEILPTEHILLHKATKN